jgi:putative ATPase
MVRLARRHGTRPASFLVAIAAMQAVHFIVCRKARRSLRQQSISPLPLSNALYTAYTSVQQDIQTMPVLPVPMHLRNAPTALMKGLGYGYGYKYPHHYPGRHVEAVYLPENLLGRVYYDPVDDGYERIIRERLQRWRQSKEDQPREQD